MPRDVGTHECAVMADLAEGVAQRLKSPVVFVYAVFDDTTHCGLSLQPLPGMEGPALRTLADSLREIADQMDDYAGNCPIGQG